MKKGFYKLLAGFLAAVMFLAAVPAAKADLTVSASAVEFVETAAEDEAVVIAEVSEDAEEEAEKPAQSSFLTTLKNFIKDFTAVIKAAIDFLKKYEIIKPKK